MRYRDRPIEGRTPLDELRRLIDQATDRMGALETGTTADALKLLRLLDDIDELYTELEAADVDLRAEAARRETIELSLRRKAGHVLRLLKPEGGIAAVRHKRQPPASSWWWRLDDYVAEQRRKALRSLATTAVIVAAVVAAGVIIYRLFLQPDPNIIAQMDHIANIERAVESGDLDAALAAADAGVAQFPENSELLLWRAVVLDLQKRNPEAEQAFARARATFSDDATFYTNSSEVRLRANDRDGAYADALKATTIAPDSPYAFLALGAAQELRGELNAASASYTTAASLAAAQNNAQVEAIAKVRLAMLLQAAPAFGVGAQPSPTR